jgi:hypothetical protein
MARFVPIEITLTGGVVACKCNLVREDDAILNHGPKPIYLKPHAVTEQMAQESMQLMEEFEAKNNRPMDEDERKEMYKTLEQANPLFVAMRDFMKVLGTVVEKETGIPFDNEI